MSKLNQGYFKPLNPEKYVGNVKDIVYRSGLECRLMHRLDNDKNVLKWSSEELAIPYVSPKDNRVHRYFPDFVIQTKTETIMIEIKPKIQTQAPKKPKSKKPGKRYLTEVMTFGINTAKWKAAKELCDKKGWRFVIMTEEDIPGSWKS